MKRWLAWLTLCPLLIAAPLRALEPEPDPLAARFSEAYHEGRFWEMRRLTFKIVDDDPTDEENLSNLAYAIALYYSPDDKALGKDHSNYAASDFDDLGGLKDPKLLAIATDASLSRFEKAVALFEWGAPLNRTRPEYFMAYAYYAIYEEGDSRRLNKDPAGACDSIKRGLKQFETAAALLRGGADTRLLARVLRDCANSRRKLTTIDPASKADQESAASAEYEEILRLPGGDTVVESCKESARRQLQTLTRPY